ncbi:MAG TPA: pyridoxine 5'-phosphate synthase, partial [Nitrospirae bacterium]|nr:pyridoxine 5'-phosphate synthase [Nitrospirota bacterium]HEW80762.1 pyridoxine 5'-phosphate synthase [Nitrospirota bacterium]
PVSLFIDPSPADIQISKDIGAQMIEIHTGLYANAKGKKQTAELNRVRKSVKKALDLGLLVNAGHGLDYTNVKRIAAIKGMRALYIGHSIISNSIYLGLGKAVREMKKLIKSASKAKR